MDRPISEELGLLCAYVAGQDGMVKLRMPFEEEQLNDLLAQDSLPKLVVFLDQQATPVLVMKEGKIQYCTDDCLGRNLSAMLMQRKNGEEGGRGRDCC